MNIKRKVLDLLAPKEVKDMLKFLDGKKTLIGVVVALIPQFVDAVSQVISAADGDAASWTKIGGTLVMVAGLLHKFLKGDPAK